MQAQEICREILMRRTDEVFSAHVPMEIDCVTLIGLTDGRPQSKYSIGSTQHWFGKVNTARDRYLTASVRIECFSKQVDHVLTITF